MAVCIPPSIVVSVSYMERDFLDDLLDAIEIDQNEAAASLQPPPPMCPSVPEAKTRSSSSEEEKATAPSLGVEVKPIRRELDPLPVADTQERTEYFTVNDYVWPTPKKRQCRRMPEEERRQRHRESQREFMMRKRSLFRAMRAEISHLEKQVRWLEARRALKALTLEQQSLQASLDKVTMSIQNEVWKDRLNP